MDTREAITALIKAGRRREVEELLTNANDKAYSSYKPILGDETLSEKGRMQQLAAAYLSHNTTVDRKLQAMAATVVSTDRDDAERVFGVKGLTGDPASLITSRRDAGDRVAAINDPKELSALLKRATRSGDEVLARAVAERAVEMQGPSGAAVMNEFLAARPTLDSAGERLWNAERAVGESMTINMIRLGLRPTELGGITTSEIEEMAKPLPTQTAEREFAPASATGFVDYPKGFVNGAIFGSED